jgi:hypothetical protein
VRARGRRSVRCARPRALSGAARGHEVLTPDLPADDDSAGLGEYTEAVVRALGDRADLIVVAQSLAAFVAPMLCALSRPDELVRTLEAYRLNHAAPAT